MRRLAACLALALLLPALPPTQASDSASDPLLYDLTVPGSGAWGLKVTTGATGRYSVEVASNYLGGPYPGHVDNFGAWLYGADKAFQFGIAIGGGVSQDRQIVQLGAGGLDGAAALPEGVTMRVDTAGTDAGTLRFDVVTATPFATRYVVGWAAGMHAAGFRVWGPLDTVVQVNTGPAYAIGDAQLEDDGAANVQVQKSYAQFQFVGAKAMAGTSTTIITANGAYGMWAAHNFKQVCLLGFGQQCQMVDAGTLCRTAGLPCDSASLSWSGPGGSGATGGRAHNLLDHRPAGTYTFTVDHKVDAYGPWRNFGVPWTGLGEDTSTLALADVALP